MIMVLHYQTYLVGNFDRNIHFGNQYSCKFNCQDLMSRFNLKKDNFILIYNHKRYFWIIKNLCLYCRMYWPCNFYAHFILLYSRFWVMETLPLGSNFSCTGWKLEICKPCLNPINNLSWFWLCQINSYWKQAEIHSKYINHPCPYIYLRQIVSCQIRVKLIIGAVCENFIRIF